MSSDPYAPPAASVNSHEDVDLKVIGLVTGLVFALPAMLVSVLIGLVMILDASSLRAIGLWSLMAALLTIGAGIVGCGRWWALRGTQLGIAGLLLGAMVQGLVSILAFQVVFHAMDSLEPQDLRASRIEASVEFVAVLIASVYALVMAVTIRWRVHRALNRP